MPKEKKEYLPPIPYHSEFTSSQGTKYSTAACGLFFRAALELQVRELEVVQRVIYLIPFLFTQHTLLCICNQF